MTNMGLYLVVIYITLIVSTFFISAVRNHKVIKRHTGEVIYNDCYYACDIYNTNSTRINNNSQ